MQFDKKNVRSMWEDELYGKRVYAGDYIKDLMVQVRTEAETTTVRPSHCPTEYPFRTKAEIFRFVYVVDEVEDEVEDGQKEFEFEFD